LGTGDALGQSRGDNTVRNKGGVSLSRRKNMFALVKKLLLGFIFLGLVGTNILTLTSTAFNTAISGLLAASLGVKTVSGLMQSKIASQDLALKKHKAQLTSKKQATRRFGFRLTQRTKRVTAKSIAAIPAESIPLIGIAVLIADTSYELYAACETIRDLDDLYESLGIVDQSAEDAIHAACNPNLPDPEKVWQNVLGKSEKWW
jgi:hypothetical protein